MKIQAHARLHGSGDELMEAGAKWVEGLTGKYTDQGSDGIWGTLKEGGRSVLKAGIHRPSITRYRAYLHILPVGIDDGMYIHDLKSSDADSAYAELVGFWKESKRDYLNTLGDKVKDAKALLKVAEADYKSVNKL